MNQLTFPLPLFREYLRRLIQQPTRMLRCGVGISRWSGNYELIAAPAHSDVKRKFLLKLSDTFDLPEALPPDCGGVLLIGYSQKRGQAFGFARVRPDQLEPIDLLRFVGPGMHTVRLHDGSPSQAFEDGAAAGQRLPIERWSRTIGALGFEVWARLVSLHYAVIGVGRTGSRIALSLARLGARRLTLVDPDCVELHNLGEMEAITDAHIGRSKVEAVARYLGSIASLSVQIATVRTSITCVQALQAVQGCDVLFACTDHDSARLATATIAALFCKPLIDIGTGVHREGPQRRMGTDIRLVLPRRCLLCFGGLLDQAGAWEVLSSADIENAFAGSRDWRRERTGSLASLNQCAVGVALRLFEDFIAERVQGSTWVHLEFDASGHITVSYPQAALQNGPSTCPICRLTGLGEEGLSRMPELFRKENSQSTGGATPLLQSR